MNALGWVLAYVNVGLWIGFSIRVLSAKHLRPQLSGSEWAVCLIAWPLVLIMALAHWWGLWWAKLAGRE